MNFDHVIGIEKIPNSQNKTIFTLKQIHSDLVGVVKKSVNLVCDISEGDALITNEKNAILAVKTADCVPILIYDTQNEVIAAIHAGWKGTAKDIVSRTIEKMNNEYGTEPQNCKAIIGPAICEKCYIVNRDVCDQISNLNFGVFQKEALEKGIQRLASHEKFLVNLKEINKFLLLKNEISIENVSISTKCTKCELDLPSYRRDNNETRRIYSYICL